MTVSIVLVYQSLLGIYGDRGNAAVLLNRLRWRGVDAELTVVEPGDPLPADGHVYLLGGGEDLAGDRDEVVEGLGVLDVETRRGDKRAVGEILTRWTRPDGTESLITGFENHGGFTRLGAGARPLATVEKGVGNGYDGTEGAVQGTVIGTYPHGPVLARNPELADHVLELALGRTLDPLPRPEIDELRRQRIAAVRS